MNYFRNIKLSFYILSFFFLFYFFIFPAFILLGDAYYYLGVEFNIDEVDFLKLLISIFIFTIGFFSFDFLLKCKPKVSGYDCVENKNINIWFYIALMVYVFYVLYKLLYTNAAEISYAVRSGESESNLINFFIYNVMEAIKFSIIISLLACKKYKQLKLFLIFVIVSLLFLSSGRLNLILNIFVFVFLFFRLSSPYISMLMFFALILGLPLLFTLKSIIYNVAMNGVLDFSYVEGEVSWDDYLRNFGHPLFSYLNIETLVSNIGYRFFWDYIQGFVFYLKLVGLDFGDSITYYNTEAILGVRSSIVPPGYFAFGYIQLAWLGVFFAGLSYRLIGKLGEYFYKSIFNESNNVAEFYIAFICANTFYHGDFRIFVMSIFFPFLFCHFFCKVAISNERK